MAGLTTANTKPIFQKNPSPAPLILTDADTTVVTSLYLAGDVGALIDSIGVTSTDTADILLQIFITDTLIDYKIGEVTVPAGSGTDGALPSINLLNTTALPFLQAGGGLPLGAAQELKVACTVDMTAATACHVVAYGGDY